MAFLPIPQTGTHCFPWYGSLPLVPIHVLLRLIQRYPLGHGRGSWSPMVGWGHSSIPGPESMCSLVPCVCSWNGTNTPGVSLEDIQQYTLQVESFHLCVPFSLTIWPDTMQACTGTSFILSSLCITTIERGLIKTPQFVLFYVLAVWLLFVCA